MLYKQQHKASYSCSVGMAVFNTLFPADGMQDYLTLESLS